MKEYNEQEFKEEMLRLSDELEKNSWILPQNQDELESAILKGMEDVKSGRIVSHEDVLKYSSGASHSLRMASPPSGKEENEDSIDLNLRNISQIL